MNDEVLATTSSTPPIRNEIIIVLLALASVGLLAFEMASELQPSDAKLIGYIDLVIALIFLTEWTVRFVRAEQKKQFFLKTWWELLASIPITNETARMLRGLRLLRVARIVRVLRVVRLGVRIKILLEQVRSLGRETYLAEITTTVGVILLSGASAFYYFERADNPRVGSFADSLWWAFITLTTVGYGDIYPVTPGGKLVAVALLLAGLGALGAFTAAIATYISRQEDDK